MPRFIGMDVHRDFAQIAVVVGGAVSDAGRVGCRPEALREWAATLTAEDQVALEVTGNSDAIAGLLSHYAGRVVVSNPLRPARSRKRRSRPTGRREDPRATAGSGLPPAGLAPRRADGNAATDDDSAGSSGAAAHSDQEPGASGAAPQSDAPAAGDGLVREDRASLVGMAAVAGG